MQSITIQCESHNNPIACIITCNNKILQMCCMMIINTQLNSIYVPQINTPNYKKTKIIPQHKDKT